MTLYITFTNCPRVLVDDVNRVFHDCPVTHCACYGNASGCFRMLPEGRTVSDYSSAAGRVALDHGVGYVHNAGDFHFKVPMEVMA